MCPDSDSRFAVPSCKETAGGDPGVYLSGRGRGVAGGWGAGTRRIGVGCMALARNTHFNQALLAIPRRAESVDRHTLARIFVVAGSLSTMLHSADHQVLYGRRGTGKTHALLYLTDLVEHSGDIAVCLDLRTTGSASGLYADQQLGLEVPIC